MRHTIKESKNINGQIQKEGICPEDVFAFLFEERTISLRTMNSLYRFYVV
ncbi:hypothetical protein ACOX9L_07755 [Enterococcus durans]|nr:hypothetical protein [Enterococcus durans]